MRSIYQKCLVVKKGSKKDINKHSIFTTRGFVLCVFTENSNCRPKSFTCGRRGARTHARHSGEIIRVIKKQRSYPLGHGGRQNMHCGYTQCLLRIKHKETKPKFFYINVFKWEYISRTCYPDSL